MNGYGALEDTDGETRVMSKPSPSAISSAAILTGTGLSLNPGLSEMLVTNPRVKKEEHEKFILAMNLIHTLLSEIHLLHNMF
jgi:hypothetical protein